MNKDDPQQRMDIYLQKNEEMIKMPVDDDSQELKENVRIQFLFYIVDKYTELHPSCSIQ